MEASVEPQNDVESRVWLISRLGSSQQAPFLVAFEIIEESKSTSSISGDWGFAYHSSAEWEDGAKSMARDRDGKELWSMNDVICE